MQYYLSCGIFNKKYIKQIKEPEGTIDGIQYLFKFKNNLGASVIKSYHSFGADKDLWELALIKWNDNKFNLMLDYDVIGYLTDSNIRKILNNIKKGKLDGFTTL